MYAMTHLASVALGMLYLRPLPLAPTRVILFGLYARLPPAVVVRFAAIDARLANPTAVAGFAAAIEKA
jgi:hypothetical protein